jgi:hypothetical protein
VLGAHHADHEKMGMTEEELAQAHAVSDSVLDAKRLMMVNRTVIRWLHDASEVDPQVYLGGVTVFGIGLAL